MNILYICPRIPYPPNQGDKVVIYNQLKFLSKNNKITLLCLVKNKKELDGIKYLSGYCGRIEAFKKRPDLSAFNLAAAIFSRDPFTVIRYYSPDMKKRSRELIESGRFDIVHVAFYYMGQYAVGDDIKVPAGTAVVLNAHNVEYLIYSKFAGLSGSVFAGLEAARVKKYESALYGRFDKCIAFSELDKKDMEGFSGARPERIAVNPACIEPSEAAGQPPEEPNSLVFFGLLSTLPNSDAVKFFCGEILPLIRTEIPDVKFYIAGGGAPKFIKGLGSQPGVRFAGYVPDIRDFIKGKALVVAPLRMGGGTRIKILEAWACGRAVISTPAGAEGVQTEDGKDIIIAERPRDFANAVIRLLKDRQKRDDIGGAALRKIKEYYSPAKVIPELEDIYRGVSAGKRGASG